MRPHAVGNGHQHGIASGVTEAVVDVFETIAVEEQHCHPLVDLGRAAQGTDQPAFEERAVGQAGEAVVAGLVGQGFVFALQVALPGLHLTEQGVEVAAQAVEFGDLRRGYAAVEVSLAAGGVGDGSQALQWHGDTI